MPEDKNVRGCVAAGRNSLTEMCRYHFSAWRSWRKHNQKLRLIQELWDLSATKHPHP